jgi:hypothetical protein
MRTPIVFMSIFSILSSCVSIKETSNDTAIILTEDNHGLLEGRYSNIAINFKKEEVRGRSYLSESTYFLWPIIGYEGKLSTDDREKADIQIDFLSDKKIRVSLMLNDSVLSSKKIKGQFKDGYFYKRPYSVMIPLFPLLYGYNTNRLRFGINTEGNLSMDYAWNTYAFFLVAGRNTKGNTNSEFKRR